MSLPLPAQRVLLVADNEGDWILVRDLLANSAAQVEWVTTYDAAYAAFTRGHYDVCLLDNHLGDRTGLEFLQELSSTSLIPIILLTSSEDYRVDVAVAQAGAADYLVKGLINAPLLERAIRYAIQRKDCEADLLQAQRTAEKA